MADPVLIVSGVLIPICAFLLWLPWSSHIAHLYPTSKPAGAALLSSDLNLESCAPISTGSQHIGPQWCAEPVVHNTTGWAYFACDDTRPWWDPVRHVWEAAPDGRQGGSLWAWHIADVGAQPFKLDIGSEGPFHPLSVSVVAAAPSQKDDGLAAAPGNLLVVSNHPFAHRKGVVDVFYHQTESAHSHEAHLYRRVAGAGLSHHSPYRVVALAEEQWSEPVAAASNSDSRPQLKLPSFLFTAVAPPVPCSTGKESASDGSDDEGDDTIGAKLCSPSGIQPHASAPTIVEHLWEVIWANLFKPSTPAHVFMHIAAGYAAKPIVDLDRTTSYYPPLVKPWDGGGSAGGSNTTLLHLLVTSTSLKSAVLEQWDQHWVRGQSYGVTNVVNPKTFKKGYVRWPSFITFWNSAIKGRVPASLDVDRYGRVWTAAAADQGAVQRLIDSLRRAPSGASHSVDAQPGALIHQTTYIHRVGPSIAHPWEVERLGSARKRGLWLPKEFYTSLIYRRGIASSPSDQTGYLPRAPTGIAVDEHRRRLIVTSSWDENVAVCSFKEGYVEM
ncbi:unnamed protein product [Parajaminaea phylloscopi]